MLVVISIIALLLSIIMPSLNLARHKAAGVVCMAVSHGDSSTFGFANGHAERHKWIGEEVKEQGDFDTALQLLAQNIQKDIEDWTWVTRHYIPIPGKLNRQIH